MATKRRVAEAMECLAVYSMKGGVGKTAGAINLAYLAASEGRRVLLWDLDPQASSTFYLRVEPGRGGGRRILRGARALDPLIRASDYPGLHLLPARFSFRNADLALAEKGAEKAKPVRHFRRLISPLAENYDLLVFDTAPGLSTMSECVLAASDVVLVPVVPTPLSLRTLSMLHDHLDRAARARVLPYFSMADRRKKLHREIIGAPESLAITPLESVIPYASQVERMGLERAPVAQFAPGCTAEQAFRALWAEVRARLGRSASERD